jgi:hypothetical protein
MSVLMETPLLSKTFEVWNNEWKTKCALVLNTSSVLVKKTLTFFINAFIFAFKKSIWNTCFDSVFLKTVNLISIWLIYANERLYISL